MATAGVEWGGRRRPRARRRRPIPTVRARYLAALARVNRRVTGAGQ